MVVFVSQIPRFFFGEYDGFIRDYVSLLIPFQIYILRIYSYTTNIANVFLKFSESVFF